MEQNNVISQTIAKTSTLGYDAQSGRVVINNIKFALQHSIGQWALSNTAKTKSDKFGSIIHVEILDHRGGSIAVQGITDETSPQEIDDMVLGAATGRNISDLTVRIVEEFRAIIRASKRS